MASEKSVATAEIAPTIPAPSPSSSQVLNGEHPQSPALPNTFDELMTLRDQLHAADAGTTEQMARMHFATTLKSMHETISTGVQNTLARLKDVDNVGNGGTRSAPALAIYQTMADNASIIRDLVTDSSFQNYEAPLQNGQRPNWQRTPSRQ